MFCRSVFWICLMSLALLICASCLSSDDSARPMAVLPSVHPPSPPGILVNPKFFSEEPLTSLEVVYFYSYSCPPCRMSESSLIPYMKMGFPQGTKLIKLPFLGLTSEDSWYSHGRMAVALELMGIEDKLHLAIMNKIQSVYSSRSNDYYTAASILVSPEEQADFIASLGYSREQYLKVLNSPELQDRLQKIRTYQNYNFLESVPAVIIHGWWYYNIDASEPDLAYKSILPLVEKMWNEKFSPAKPQSPQAQPPGPRL
ncbi:MAG: hypothetical protein LBK52_03960 [Deltaproteobacteria bacterium]|nr:hypothetical protein [Deltaproteobacteria bacterium]